MFTETKISVKFGVAPRLGVTRVMSPDVRYGHRSLGGNGASPSRLRLFPTPAP